MTELRKALEEAEISFILLKGSVIMDFYPEPWMRTSSDIDVLVKEEDFERAKQMLIAKGYVHTHNSPHDISFASPENTHIELHHTLIEAYRFPETAKVLERVWTYAFPARENGYEYRLRNEMFYYYHIAHMVKHFENGGCGIRPFLDIWFLRHRAKFDERQCYELLSEGKILTFAQFSEKLSEIWFSGAEYDAPIVEFENYILNGGIYGTQSQGILIRKSKVGKGLKYRISRLFLPVEQMKTLYPVLQRHPALLPLCYIRRAFNGVFNSEKRRRAIAELQQVKSSDNNTQKKVEDLLMQLGI